MKEIVVISGKGGTGKTSITAALGALARNPVVADRDVDAADLDLLLGSKLKEEHSLVASKKAEIISQKCTGCGVCSEVCEYDAVKVEDGKFSIDPFMCEGCGACVYFCPEDAISFQQEESGKYFISESKYGPFIHAVLIPGEENSGKLVVTVKNNAKKIASDESKDYILVDGSPGTGCPVIASISGADYVVIVTEPTFSGKHDLERVLSLSRHFQIPCGVVINKSDINERVHREICEDLENKKVPLLGSIRWDDNIKKAMIQGRDVIAEFPESEVSYEIREIWKNIQNNLEDCDE